MKYIFNGILIFLALCVVSWAIVCGFIKLIALCFGFSITLLTATGIWLVIFLLNILFKKKEK